MKLLTALAALSIAGTCSANWRSLRLKYDILLNGYFPIALTQHELLGEGENETRWQYMATDSELNVDFYSYGADPRVSIGFDTYGNIAGVRVSYIISDLPKKAIKNGLTFPYTFDDKPIFSKATYYKTEVFYTTVLFVSPGKLAEGGRTNTGSILADDVYIKLDGKYTVIPRDERDAPKAGFVKQGCVYGMGRHYFYKTDNTSQCNDSQGVFLLYDDQELIGTGLSPYGSFTNGQKDWFEDPGEIAFKLIVPDRPSCVLEWRKKYGVTSLHLFFNDHPRTTTC